MLNALEEWKKLHEFQKYSSYLTKDLAEFLNVSPRTIQRWIKGTTNLDNETLEKIETYLSKRSKNPQNKQQE